MTTCRKAITIILSFTLFSKPFVFEYVKNVKYISLYFALYPIFTLEMDIFLSKIINIMLKPYANIVFK